MKRYKRPLKSKEEYFKNFTVDSLKELTQIEIDKIYNSYYMRHTVFNRDNFHCQIEECKFKDSPLTLHHYKHKSNQGKDSPRNGVTVCYAHQNQYHRGRGPLKFKNTLNLPSHIRGYTQALHEYTLKANGEGEIKTSIKFTYDKATARQLRKDNKQLHGKRLTLEEILSLFIWLYKYAVQVEVDDTPLL